MGLREIAEQDNAFLVEDGAAGFATDVTLDDNAGNTYPAIKGVYFRVGVTIDPNTGQTVVGEQSHVTVRLSSLTAIPEDGWKCTVADITGSDVVGYVTSPMPDRTLGRMSWFLRGVA